MAKCPQCASADDRTIQLLATTNEWRWYCSNCDLRFNDKGELLPPKEG